MTTAKFCGGPLDGKVEEDFDLPGVRILQMEIGDWHPHWMWDGVGHRTRLCESHFPDCMYHGHRMWQHEYALTDYVDDIFTFEHQGRTAYDPYANLPLAP